MSVRKSHLQGRNHIKLYCNYYEQVLKNLGIYEDKIIDLQYIDEKAPGNDKEADESGFKLPPPPTSANMPNPPPSVLNQDGDKELVVYHELHG